MTNNVSWLWTIATLIFLKNVNYNHRNFQTFQILTDVATKTNNNGFLINMYSLEKVTDTGSSTILRTQ